MNGTILIADDSMVVRAVLRRQLEADGHTVVEAVDGQDAIAHFQLGLAFELLGDQGQSRRALSAARAALGRSSAAAEAALEGYQIAELVRLIDHRLTRTPEP